MYLTITLINEIVKNTEAIPHLPIHMNQSFPPTNTSPNVLNNKKWTTTHETENISLKEKGTHNLDLRLMKSLF